MADEPTLKVANYPEWHNALSDWVRVSKMGIVDAFRYQARQIGNALVGGYDAAGRKQWNQSTPPNDRKQGESALVRDIHRAVFPLRAEGFRNIKVQKKVRVAVQAEDVAGLQAMVNAGVFGAERSHMIVRPAGNEFSSHQQSRRTRGRVDDKVPRFATVGVRYLKEYVNKAKHAVGQAKGGWAAGLLALGGRVPAWVSRHARAGTYVDNLRPGQAEVRFSFINRSKWAGDPASRRIPDAVMQNRAALIHADIGFLIENNWTRNARGQIVK